jgi:hypothetical protein
MICFILSYSAARSSFGLRRRRFAGFHNKGRLEIAICDPDCDQAAALIPEQIVTPGLQALAFRLLPI